MKMPLKTQAKTKPSSRNAHILINLLTLKEYYGNKYFSGFCTFQPFNQTIKHTVKNIITLCIPKLL